MMSRDSRAGWWSKTQDLIKRVFTCIPVIAPSSTKATDLLVAVPVSSLAGGAAISLTMGVANPLLIIIQLPLLPLVATFLALYVFPFAVIACVPAYLILRRYNQLRFRTCFIAGGAFGGAVATFGSLLSNGGLGAIVLFAVTGFATAAAAYQTLALLAMRRSPNNAFESGPPSAAAQRER